MPADRPLRSIRPRPPSKPYPVATPSKPTRSPSPPPNLAAVEDVKPAPTSPTPSPSSTPTPKAKAKVKAKGKKGTTKATVKDEVTNEPTAKGGYDRALLVTLVAKATNANFDALGGNINKSATQCRDTWRKTVFPALIGGRDWSSTGPGWDNAMKLHLAREVLGTAKPDWNAIAPQYDRTLPVHDIWRKVVLPRIMSGKPLNKPCTAFSSLVD